MSPVGLGVIGAGGIAMRRMLPALSAVPGAHLASVMDVDAGVAAAVGARFGAQRHVARVSDLLADEAVEAVYLASPVDAHAEQALAVLRAGRPLLIEKPLARNVAEAETIAEAARASGLHLQVAFMMRYHPLHLRLRALLAEEAIGRVVTARARLSCWYPELLNAWRQDPARGGGGSLMDLGVHAVDLLTWLLGSVRRVTALTGTLAFGYAVEDTATLLLEFESRAQASVEACFSVPDSSAPSRLEIHGTEGSLVVEGTLGQEARGTLRLTRCASEAYDPLQRGGAAVVSSWDADGAVDLYAAELADFLAGGEGPAACSAAEALRVQRVMEAAYAAAGDSATKDLAD